MSDTTFECVCADGYEGIYCESEANECLSGPCLNGGTCTDLFNAYSCQCTQYFFGDTCEKGSLSTKLLLLIGVIIAYSSLNSLTYLGTLVNENRTTVGYR